MKKGLKEFVASYGLIFFSAIVVILLTIQLLFDSTRYRNLAFLYGTVVSMFLVFLFFNKVDMILQNEETLYASSKRIHEDTRTITESLKETSNTILNAPVIKQYPELPRGCEVTALAMLLQFEGVNVGKIKLANEIRRDTTPYKVINKQVYYGHPNKGYVGNMYNLEQPGYGVYHSPIVELARKYLPNQIEDISGKDFKEVEKYLSNKKTVWVITNVTYKKLPKSSFEKWITPDGEINITYKEHSVLVTGFDEQFIYFNDPITGMKNKRSLKKDFIESWKQMGSQAVTVKIL